MRLEPLLFTVFCTIICLVAIWRGGRPEQVVGCGFLLAFYGAVLTHWPYQYSDVEWGMAAIDLCLLLLIGVVAVGSTRYWGMPMASMQLVDVLGHLTKLLDPGMLPQAYFGLVGLISWPMLCTLAAGVIWHRRRLARFGVDYDWAGDLPLRYRDGWEASSRHRRSEPN